MMPPPPKVPPTLPPVILRLEMPAEKLAATVGLMSITRSAVVCWIVVLAARARR